MLRTGAAGIVTCTSCARGFCELIRSKPYISGQPCNDAAVFAATWQRTSETSGAEIFTAKMRVLVATCVLVLVGFLATVESAPAPRFVYLLKLLYYYYYYCKHTNRGTMETLVKT